jgi:hypothetical protein
MFTTMTRTGPYMAGPDENLEDVQHSGVAFKDQDLEVGLKLARRVALGDENSVPILRNDSRHKRGPTNGATKSP